MSRNLLHITRLEEFKLWLDGQRIVHRPGRGDYEVLQVQVHAPLWYCLFNRIGGGPGGWQKEHFTVDIRMDPLVGRFVRDRKRLTVAQTPGYTGIVGQADKQECRQRGPEPKTPE